MSRCGRCSRSAGLATSPVVWSPTATSRRGSKIRLIRDGKVITEDLTIDTLRRGKEDVREVRNGFECGIKLSGYDDIKLGDKFEAYVRGDVPADALNFR